MRYALLGDIHSSIEDLKKVRLHIKQIAPDAKLIGTGDLFECTISKKDMNDKKFTCLKDVMLIPDGFTELLTFPSVSGNQEERILHITASDNPLRQTLSALPERLEIEHAEVIHGHQWKWGGDPFALIQEEVNSALTFYGHSHHSMLKVDGKNIDIDFVIPYDVYNKQVIVNVGSVVSHQEWVLYDSEKRTVTFMKA